MSKARMQPAAQTGIVWKISIFLFLLLAVVLYKMNDYFKQEKWNLAQTQLRTQIVSLKTSVSSQISTLKNVLSSHEYELTESKINWVQLDPFFGIATAQKVGGRSSNQFKINQFIGRSGSIGENWNANFLEKMLSRQVTMSDQPITVQLFQDNTGAKYITLRFVNSAGRALVVVGGADYFQKYFDLSRGGKMTALLETTDHYLAAHSEADYLGTLIDENAVSAKKFILEKEEIAGTNLVAMSFISRKAITKDFAVPWSVVGLIIGFGLLIVGVLIYTLDPIDRRIEKYKMQEREQIFKETLSNSLPASLKATPVQASDVKASQTATDIVKVKVENAAQEPVVMGEGEPDNSFRMFQGSADDDVPTKPVSGDDGFKDFKNFEDEASVVLDDVPYDNSDDEFKINQEMKPVVVVVEKPFVGNFDENYSEEKSIFGSAPLLNENLPPVVKPVTKPQSGVITLDEDDLDLSESTFAPMKQTDVSVFASSENEGLDLDKALSLDELESEEVAQSSVRYVQQNLTSKKINITQQVSEIKKPQFAVKRKEFQVDAMQVSVRRPDRS